LAQATLTFPYSVPFVAVTEAGTDFFRYPESDLLKSPLPPLFLAMMN
jgi:hypothetical protein